MKKIFNYIETIKKRSEIYDDFKDMNAVAFVVAIGALCKRYSRDNNLNTNELATKICALL